MPKNLEWNAYHPKITEVEGQNTKGGPGVILSKSTQLACQPTKDGLGRRTIMDTYRPSTSNNASLSFVYRFFASWKRVCWRDSVGSNLRSNRSRT